MQVVLIGVNLICHNITNGSSISKIWRESCEQSFKEVQIEDILNIKDFLKRRKLELDPHMLPLPGLSPASSKPHIISYSYGEAAHFAHNKREIKIWPNSHLTTSASIEMRKG